MNDELYQELLLQHSKRPKNFGVMENPTHTMEGYNALCGDEITLALKVLDDAVADVKFTGSSCAICTASASIMTSAIKGHSCAEVKQLSEKFRLLAKEGKGSDDLPPSMLVLGGIYRFPQRVKCAVLPWETLMMALG
ncbi:MAG: SUF system NifU family Fe-S cluster assembly protein [Verrucomicrobia bacterium RIFCSPHIGHO2_12_FULL_41_10]|nr:MAG: SUF system NifU family Fe-S cluster assembly protein [Verrucomicrobia bacterium RIFCSPHIGHO2_12_FULL_41_10]HLB33637.1 SUF system NifU family Fe-S cluster assembly protein [Chthoniobacterales bacterium]